MVKISSEPVASSLSIASTLPVVHPTKIEDNSKVENFEDLFVAPPAGAIKAAPLIKPVSFPKKTKIEYEYLRSALEHRRPPTHLKPITESPTYSFNHTHEYAIEDGFLWYRDRGRRDWKPLYFDGFKNARVPVSLTADGANLLVLDHKNQVHYKKILKEYRASEIDYEKDPHCLAAREKIQDCPYVALDINETSKWETKWFSLPVLHLIVNAFRGRRLVVPDDAMGFTISHRGRYNDYVEDKVGQHHFVGTGVTTGYVLAKNGQDIPKKDPWSPPGAKTTIYLPETADTVFVGEQIAASASTVAVLGFETRLSTRERKMGILTRLGDIDTDGGDPFLKYDYFKDDNDPDRRVLPTDEGWQKHTLPLRGLAMVTKSLTISQTGEGNKARLLTINGTNEEGIWGYYRKTLEAPNWEFIPVTRLPADLKPLRPTRKRPTTSSVHNYVGSIDRCVASMENFGLRSTHSKIRVKIGDKDYYLHLYRRFSFANFIGIDKSRYDLVIPTDDPELKKMFGDKKVISARVSEKEDVVKIRSPLFTKHPFKISLGRIDA